MKRTLCLPLAACAALSAQTPDLLVQPHAHRVAANTALSWTLRGNPGALFALFADPQPGPGQIFGAPVNLGLTSDLISLQIGFLSAAGSNGGSIGFVPPAAMAGLPFYLQHVEGMAGQLGSLVPGVPESVAFHSGSRAIIEDFRANGQRWTGTFDPLAPFRLQAAPVTRRTQRTDGGGVGAPLPFGLQNPLNTHGSRLQMVFRAQDVGASGREEVLTSIAWLSRTAVVAETLPGLTITASHTAVVPDYTVDPFSALPQFPNSGLDPTFANNPTGTRTVLMAGSYSIAPQNQTTAGFVPYSLTNSFVYDGTSSLLLDIECTPTTPARPALNGQWGRVMVGSTPDPAARVHAEGTASAPLQPGTATTGQGDNFLYEYELGFLAVRSVAVSPWFAGGSNPDYMTPVIGQQVPPGTTYTLEFRGADDNLGTNPTGWGNTQDIADGRSFLQVRANLVGDVNTGAVPFIDTLVVPIR